LTEDSLLQCRSFNDFDGFQDVDWVLGLIGFSPDREAADLGFDAPLVAALRAARYDSVLGIEAQAVRAGYAVLA